MALKAGYKGFKKVGSGLSISKDGILKATGGGGGGSNVEINPEGAPTAGRLNKLKVDDDIVTVSYGNATTEAAGLMSTDDKSKLNGIEAQANKYVLPTASTSELGGVKVDGITVTIEDGVISATGGGGGTTVTPNPEGSATADLTKLGIDATIYGVKDSGAYHTNDGTESTFADSDYVPFYDSSASAPKKSTWSNFKAKLKAYFDTVYLSEIPTASTSTLGGVKVDGSTITISNGVISSTGGGGGGSVTAISKSAYDALPTADKNNGNIYMVTGTAVDKNMSDLTVNYKQEAMSVTATSSKKTTIAMSGSAIGCNYYYSRVDLTNVSKLYFDVKLSSCYGGGTTVQNDNWRFAVGLCATQPVNNTDYNYKSSIYTSGYLKSYNTSNQNHLNEYIDTTNLTGYYYVFVCCPGWNATVENIKLEGPGRTMYYKDDPYITVTYTNA